MVDGHIVEFRQVVHGAERHLHVNVRVPRHDLAVPPPAKQRAVHDPGLRADVVHRGEISLHQRREMGRPVTV